MLPKGAVLEVELLTVTVREPAVAEAPLGSVTRRARLWAPLATVVVFQLKRTPGLLLAQ